tara:strand:+ start:121 stop:591 length:471 start_codon:yes stop_codon:yes gene_type:complete
MTSLVKDEKKNELKNSDKDSEKESFFLDKIESGKNIMENNDFFNDLSELMENPRFLNFYNKYLYNTNEIKTTMIYMKLYENIKNKYKEFTDKDLNKYVNIFLLHQIMTKSRLRRIAIDSTLKHLDNNKINIFKDVDDYFDKFLKNEPKTIKKSLSL